MLISRTDLIAIVAVVDVAIHGHEEPVAASDVGPRYGLPLRYFESVLRTLARRGILAGKRGKCGGFQLARAPQLITVDDVLREVRAMQGGVVSRRIVSSIEKRLALPALEEAQVAFSQALQSITIADLVSSATIGSVAQKAAAVKWPVSLRG